MNRVLELILNLTVFLFIMFLFVMHRIQDPGSVIHAYVPNLISYIPEVKSKISSSFSPRHFLPMCPKIPENLEGKVNISQEIRNMEDIAKDLDYIKQGGIYEPTNCTPVYNVAILVAYRWRYNHLLVFLNNLHPVLARHNIRYRIFIINQNGNNKFNKAIMWNVGFTVALKLEQFDCVFFHDVDHLPEDDRMLYHCPAQIWHVAGAGVHRFGYEPAEPESNYVGGVLAMSTTHYKILNGFSNLFWGWGGEDDDLYNRIMFSNLGLLRLQGEQNRMMTLVHQTNETGNEVNPIRVDLLSRSKENLWSGLSSLSTCRYQVTRVVAEKLYTNISVTLEAEDEEIC